MDTSFHPSTQGGLEAESGENVCDSEAQKYLHMALQTDNQKQAGKYARRALELNPDMLEAELLLIAKSSGEPGDAYQRKLEALLKKGEAQLSAKGITREKNARYNFLYGSSSIYRPKNCANIPHPALQAFSGGGIVNENGLGGKF